MKHVWQDGRLIAPEDAHVAIADRGLLLGDGLFETMAVYNSRAFDLDAHLERLASGLGLLGFGQTVDIHKLRAGIAHYLASEAASSAVLRVTVTRRNEHSALSRVKALPYLDNVLALSEARAHGADDALMLNTRGTIACASVANVFAIRDGRLQTPPVSDGALPGTMRALVLSLSEQAGLAPVENSLDFSGLGEADHVFLTNSVSRVTEARLCNGTLLQRRAGAALDRLRGLIASRFDAA